MGGWKGHMAGEVDKFSAALDAIYQGTGGLDQWPAVVRAVCGYVGAEMGQFHILDISQGEMPVSDSLNIPEYPRQEWQERWQYIDPVPQTMVRKLSTAIRCTDVITPDEAKRSEVINELLLPNGLRWRMGCAFAQNNRFIAGMGIFRPPEGEPFSEDEEHRFTRLIPHLRRAFDLQVRLEDLEVRASSLTNVLEKISDAVLLCTRYGEVILANRSAEALLRQEDGLWLRRRRISGADAGVTASLLASLSAATQPRDRHSAPVLLPRSSDRPPLVAHVIGLPKSHRLLVLAPQAEAMVTIIDSQRRKRTPEADMSSFGLTPAEARLAIAVGHGERLEDLAEQWNVSKGTLRTHLLRVFRKLNISRQTDLAIFVATLRSINFGNSDESP